MCSQISTPAKAALELIAKKEGLIIKEEFDKQYYNIVYTQPLLPVTLSTESHIIQTARLRLINLWTTDKKQEGRFADAGSVHLNRLFVRPCYKICIQKYRGLLWVDGFTIRTFTSEKDKAEQHYYKPDKEIFTIGIIYTPRTNPKNRETMNTFSIITTSSKGMPLVIPEEKREKWLHDHSEENIRSCFKTMPKDFFSSHVNKCNFKKMAENLKEKQLAPI